MPKPRRPRLSWFRFYADDFLGGTGALTAHECGKYLLLLLYQWGTKDVQLVPSDPDRLRVICRGEDPGASVLSKFVSVDGCLRNQRLADEWSAAKLEFRMKSEGGRWHIPPKTPAHIAPNIPSHIQGRNRPPSKIQDPRPKKEGTEEQTLPPADRTERAITASVEALRTRLYALIDRMVGADPQHRDPTELMRLVTEYTKPDGTKVTGRINAATLSYERLEKSVADAEWHLAQWSRDGKSGQAGTVQHGT